MEPVKKKTHTRTSVEYYWQILTLTRAFKAEINATAETVAETLKDFRSKPDSRYPKRYRLYGRVWKVGADIFTFHLGTHCL